MTKTIKYYIIVSIIIFSVLIILSQVNLQIKGEYTYQIIAWSWIVFTLYIIIKFRIIIYIKIYAIVLLALVGLSILPMAIPFFVIINFLFNTNTSQTIKLNNEYKIEVTKKILAMKRVYIYKTESKFLVLENKDNLVRPDYSEIVAKTLDINSDDPNLYNYESEPIQNAKFIAINKDSIGIEYQILDKKKIIYHNLNETYGY